ncbi:AMP-binding protein [Ktedonobacter racemifer]|uniref:AMP-dependent synthetase and ligase n=1 Tax=Ktedonobacter racemifer DSM 44963 TaxID=485913 RepID=D6TM33_KTERA|nr:AMP-binding protein [Ktedonobacter racemifer]EFH86833.1 AMP-dependent synthetase and ligase [Ktedonobacter racemifer DSM 44963]
MTESKIVVPQATSEEAVQKWSYISGIGDIPLLGLTIGDMFDQTVASYPDHLALIAHAQQIRWTYRELHEQVERCARGLMSLGIEKGDRVGIWSLNRAEWCVTQFATAKIGAILVNINPAYRLHELEYALKQSGCSALVISPAFKSSNYPEMVMALTPELVTCEPGALQSARLPALHTVICMGEDATEGMFSWEALLKRAEQVGIDQLYARQRTLEFDDPINVQYTSGTTGFPKGATLSHHNILNNGYFVARLQNFTHEDKLCIPVPLYHCFGMVMGNLGCVTHGATMVYPSESFDPLAVLQAVQEEQCTALYGVPTMFIAELEHPDFHTFDLVSLRTGVMAGSPCPIEVMRNVINRMHMSQVEICYGMTETAPVSVQSRLDSPFEKRVATVGQIHPHLEIKIVNPESGQIVPQGIPGELCTRGYSVMLGYWDNPEATQAAIDQARWMHTGDLATMDEEGYINIVGRIKDMIIRGGENIYPREIEEFLYTHPQVSDVQVIGVPDERYGEEIAAWIKLKPGASVSQEDLRAFCLGKIAHYKIPRYIKFVDAYPMTISGKIQKYLMRQQAIAELGLQDAASIETA